MFLCFPSFNHYFYLEFGYELGPQRIRNLAFVGPFSMNGSYIAETGYPKKGIIPKGNLIHARIFGLAMGMAVK